MRVPRPLLVAVVLLLPAAFLLPALRSHRASAVTSASRVGHGDLRTLQVDDSAGVPQAFATPGAVLVISTTCHHCHQTLAALAAAAGGTPLPGLRVLVLEGARAGQAVLDSLQLQAAVVGPHVGDRAALQRALRLTSTPTLVHLDAHGQVTRVLAGAPSAAELDALVVDARLAR